MKIKFILSAFIGILFLGCTQQTKLTPDEARQIAKKAYIYGFPMVVNYKTMYAYALDKNSPEFKGEFNQKSCEARLFTPEDKAVVTPNSDTPYCMFWCDIHTEPAVITVPDIEPERYYSFQLVDLYTHNFAYIGTLTTGNKAGTFLIASTGWKGEKPDGIDEIIRCETDAFFVVVRTQLMGDDDLDNVKKIQDSYRLQMLSGFLGQEAPTAKVDIHFPEWNEGDQFTAESFKYLDVMLKMTKPVESEVELRKQFARLGIGTDEGFNLSNFDEDVQQAISEGVKYGFTEIEEFIKEHSGDPLGSAKMFGTREFLTKSAIENYNLDNLFLPRAVAGHMGLYGNSGFEAIYPTYLVDADRKPLNAAEYKYTITFKADDLPPVKAFWSLSMYDGKTQLFIHNKLVRYLINSNNIKDFVYSDDGSITIYIQKDSPGAALEANWLPAPDGPFYIVMRLYGPKEAALTGEWVNPPIIKSK